MHAHDCEPLISRFVLCLLVTTAEKGHGEEQDVLFCVYLGSTDKDLWEKYVLNNIGDESGYYNDPFQGFIKNENVPPEKDICL